MPHDTLDVFEPERGRELAARKLSAGDVILAELRAVLAAHPGGLRRWSVMRGIRQYRERAGQDVPQNFEAEVERTFRRYCVDAGPQPNVRMATDALFFRPSEKAGEVWAIIRDRVSSERNDAFAEMDEDLVAAST